MCCGSSKKQNDNKVLFLREKWTNKTIHSHHGRGLIIVTTFG